MEDRVGLEESFPTHGMILLFWWVATALFWYLAFFEIEPTTPDWLQRARVACFGQSENGLPHGGGWILLTLGPLSLLAALWVSFPTEVTGSFRALGRRTFGRILAVVIVSATLFEARWAWGQIQLAISRGEPFADQQLDSLPEGYPRTARPAPELGLINQRGESATLSGLSGKPTILTFAFAHCQTICPLLIRTGEAALEDLSPGAATFLIVTLDPWRDTVGALPGLAKRWKLSADAQILSGPVADVERVLTDYQVPRTRDQQTGDVVHPALVYVLDQEGRIAYSFNNPSSRWLVEAIKRLEKVGEDGSSATR